MPNEIAANLSALVSRPAGVPRSSQTAAAGPADVRQPLPSGGQPLPQQQEQGGEVPERELDEAVSRIQDYVQNLQRDLKFSVDQESGRTIIKVVDSETEEVIRQIPPEEILAISEYIQDNFGGVLLRVQA